MSSTAVYMGHGRGGEQEGRRHCKVVGGAKGEATMMINLAYGSMGFRVDTRSRECVGGWVDVAANTRGCEVRFRGNGVDKRTLDRKPVRSKRAAEVTAARKG